MVAARHPDGPCNPAVTSRRLDAQRNRSVSWLAARPVSQIAKHHGGDWGRSSAEEMTDVGPESTVAGLGEEELAILRHVGEHWGPTLAGRPSVVARTAGRSGPAPISTLIRGGASMPVPVR